MPPALPPLLVQAAVVRIKALPLGRLYVGCAPWAVRLLAVVRIKVLSLSSRSVGCALYHMKKHKYKIKY